MRVLLFALFVLFLSGIAATSEYERLSTMDPMKDRKAFLKQAVKAYKESKSKTNDHQGNPQYLQFLENKRSDEINLASVCVGCPNLLLLTEQVNKILQEQKKILPADTPRSVFNEIDSLEGLFYFVQSEDENGDLIGTKGGCEKLEYGAQNLYPKHVDLNFDNHIMLFTEEVNFKNITQIHFTETGKKKTYYLKGKRPNDDVIVKVVVDQRKPAVVTYYRHKEVILRKKIQAKKDATDKIAFTKKLEKKGDSDPLEDKFLIDYGVETDDDSFIPKKVTILGLDGVSHFESTTFRAKTEISSDKIGAEVSLSSFDKKDFVKVDVDESAKIRLHGRSDFESFAISSQVESKGGKNTAGVQLRDEKDNEVVGLNIDEDGLAQIGVPLQFNVYDTGLLVDGRVVAGQDGLYGGTWVISDRNTKTRYVDVGMKASKDGGGVSIGHSQKAFNEDSTFSVKISHDDFKEKKETSAWINYSYKF